MPEKKPGGLKLKLRNKADTNRLKTQTGRLKTESADESASEAQTKAVPVPPQPAVAPPANQTAEIQDPMALRDTSHGKLKRVKSPDETANAVSPETGEPGVKQETVRLKVVRDKKKGGPQILPGPGAPPPAAADAPPPPPPAAEVAAAPSAQTIKISLPGLKKGPQKAGQAALKRSTSTVRVQEPEEGAGSTLKVSPPKPGSGEYRETSTATLKVAAQKPAEAPSPAGTLKINPSPAPAGKKEDAAQSKQVTATLKVRPGAESAPAPAPAAAEPPISKNVTATLKIRSGEKGAADSASTVKISPPEPAAPSEEAAPAGRPSLRLKKPGKSAEPADTVRLPTPEPAANEDASKTVSLSTEPTEDQPPAEGDQKGLKLKPGKGEDAAEDADAAAEAEAEAAAASKPKPTADGPGPISFIIRFAACGALGALVYRLVMDFLAI